MSEVKPDCSTDSTTCTALQNRAQLCSTLGAIAFAEFVLVNTAHRFALTLALQDPLHIVIPVCVCVFYVYGKALVQSVSPCTHHLCFSFLLALESFPCSYSNSLHSGDDRSV